jgi:hypothetical protein
MPQAKNRRGTKSRGADASKLSAAAAGVYKPWRTEGSSTQQPHRLGEIFAANVWVTIFPFCTMKVSVPSSKRLSAVSALHTM